MNSRIIFLPTVVLSNLVLFLWWYFRAGDFIFIIGAVVLLNLVLARWLNSHNNDWWSFALLPIISTLSALAYILIISNANLVLAIIIGLYIVLIIYWRLIFRYIFRHSFYKPFSLERFFYYFSFLMLFLFSAAAYGIKTFLNVPLWQLVIAFFIFQIILTYLWSWTNKLDLKIVWPYSLALIVMITELFLAVNLLPLNFNISAFVIASSWHGLSFLATEHISGRLSYRRSRFIISLIVIIWLAVLITARWF